MTNIFSRMEMGTGRQNKWVEKIEELKDLEV